MASDRSLVPFLPSDEESGGRSEFGDRDDPGRGYGQSRDASVAVAGIRFSCECRAVQAPNA